MVQTPFSGWPRDKVASSNTAVFKKTKQKWNKRTKLPRARVQMKRPSEFALCLTPPLHATSTPLKGKLSGPRCSLTLGHFRSRTASKWLVITGLNYVTMKTDNAEGLMSDFVFVCYCCFCLFSFCFCFPPSLRLAGTLETMEDQQTRELITAGRT